MGYLGSNKSRIQQQRNVFVKAEKAPPVPTRNACKLGIVAFQEITNLLEEFILFKSPPHCKKSFRPLQRASTNILKYSYPKREERNHDSKDCGYVFGFRDIHALPSPCPLDPRKQLSPHSDSSLFRLATIA
jgi:hypothetical protein